MLLLDDSHLKSEMGEDMRLSDRIGRRLKLQELHVLMTVVQAGTMGKAARHLNTTQPNISRAIAELEHAFGVRLLDRHRQGITPTEYGRALLDCGTAVFDDLRQGVKKIELLADPGAGEVRIGCTNYNGETFVTAVIERLSRRHPRMTFHLVTTEDDTDKLYRDLYERNVDFVIAPNGGRLSDPKLGFEILYARSPVIVAGSRSPWVRRRRIALADLVNEPWVLPSPDGTMWSTYLDIFRAGGLDHPRIAVFATPPGARLNLVATGRFLSIITSVVRLSKRPEIAVLPVKLQYATVPVGLFTLKNRTLSPTAQLFIDEAREVAKPLARRKW
jgi:DNA-binding transcriptional LysR family regulator